MIRFRREHPIFHRRHFFHGRAIRGLDVKDIVWLDTEGGEMKDTDWREAHARCLGVFLSGDGLTETDEQGRALRDASFLVLFNAHDDDIPFPLPRFLPPCDRRPLRPLIGRPMVSTAQTGHIP